MANLHTSKVGISTRYKRSFYKKKKQKYNLFMLFYEYIMK